MKRTRLWAARLRVLVALIAILCADLVFSSPASAGTLTAPTWSFMDARTNIPGNRYDYGFTTATAGTVSRVTATVPAGTSGSDRYLAVRATALNSASTSDSPQNSITGNIDIRIKVAFASAAPPFQVLASKVGASNISYQLGMTPGKRLQLNWSSDGTDVSNVKYSQSSVAVDYIPDKPVWLRSTLQLDNGSGSSLFNFYTSSDGQTWTQLGTTRTASAIANIYDGTADVMIGANVTGGSPLAGKVYYTDIRNNLGAVTPSPSTCTAAGVVNCFDPNNDTIGGTTWTSASATGETWTVNRSGTNLPADIASDLSVMNVSGVTAGGTAQLREIDSIANYTLPTPQALAASIPVKLGLAGMTNTFTQGVYSTVLKTVDATGAAIDTSAPSVNASIVQSTSTQESLKPPVYSSPISALQADIKPGGIAISGTSVFVSDKYSSNIHLLNTTTGNLSTYAGNGASSNDTNTGAPATVGLFGPQGMAFDGSGNLVVAEQNASQIRKFTSSATSVLAGVAGSFSFSGDGTTGKGTLSTPQGVAYDSAGNLYIADANNRRIRKIDTGGNLSTFVGTGAATSTGDGGQANVATIQDPRDVFVASNNLYIADGGACRIRKVDLGTGIMSTVAGNGNCGFTGDGGAATSAQIGTIQSVAVATNGDVYMADRSFSTIRKVTSGSNLISTVAGTGVAGYSGDGGAATSALLREPLAVRIDSAGTIYVSDYGNSRLRAITGGVISTIAGTGQSSYTGDGGPLAKARLWNPNSVASDSAGNVYVSEGSNNVIRKINQWGMVSTLAGNGNYGFSGDGGPAASATIASPGGVAVDAAGSVYIADNGNRRIRKVTNGIISTYASTGSYYPAQIAFDDKTDTLYAIAGGTTILKITSAGVVSLFAGTGVGGFSGDGGPALSATFSNIRALLPMPNGDLLVADASNGRVRKIDSSGIVTTIAGGGASGTSNIRATTAALPYPTGLELDGLGNVLIGDYAVRRLSIGGAVQSVSAANMSNGGIACSLGSIFNADYYNMTIRKVADVCPVAPLVNNDLMSVPMNTPRSWPILSNDWSRSGEMDPSSVTITAQPIHGSVALSVPTTEASTLQAVFTPTNGYMGTDTFSYNACDITRVRCASATVSVSVGSNEVTTFAGGPAEGYAISIGTGGAQEVARFGRYLFVTDIQQNILRRIDTYSGQSVVVAGNGVGGDGSGVANTASISLTRGVAVAPDGTIVLADLGNNKVKQISTNGVLSTVAGTGAGGYAGDGSLATAAIMNAPIAVAYAIDGSVFVSTQNAVRRFVIGGNIAAFAGSTTAGFSGDAGPASNATLRTPRGLSVSSLGDLYIADSDNNRIRKISLSGTITTVAGTGTPASTGDGNQATLADVNVPKGVAVDAAGNIYITEWVAAGRIRKIAGATSIITTVAGGGAGFVNGSALATSAVAPTAIAPNVNGDFWYLSDSRVRYVNTGGNVADVTRSSAIHSGDGGPAIGTALNLTNVDTPIAADPSGNLYISEVSDNRIRRIDAVTGLVSTAVGNGNPGNSSVSINAPQQVSFDTAGNLVFGEYNNCQVRRRNSDGSLTVLAGNGTCTTTPTLGGSATSTSIGNVRGAYAAPNGDLYVADNNPYVYRVRAGVISVVAGTGTAGYSGDGGPATAAMIGGYSTSVVADSAGNVYFVDSNNARIRRIDPAGNISTILGTGTSVSAGDGGPATAASTTVLRSIALDATNNLFISEAISGKLRKIDHATGVVTTIAGTGTTAFSDNVTAASATFLKRSGIAVIGTDVLLTEVDSGRIRKVAGVANSSANGLSTASWSVVPPAVGHVNLRERFSVVPKSDVTSSRLTMTLPPAFTATPNVVESFGISGTVSPSVSGNVLTLNFTSQVLAAGVPIAVSIEGISNGGNNGAHSSYVTVYDSVGTTQLGWFNTNAVLLASSGAPSAGGAGFGSLWKRSLSTSATVPTTVSVSPLAGSDSTGTFTLTSTGSVNGSAIGLAASSATTGVYALSAVTPDTTTSVAAASFPLNRWGMQIASTTGVNQGATGSGLYNGLPTALTPVMAGTSAANVTTLTLRARVNYQQPAGVYRSSVSWRFNNGL